MSFIKKVLLSVLALTIVFQGLAHANKKLKQTENQNIAMVIEAFRLAIINKDKPVFVNLFYNETVPWLGVVSDKTMAGASKSKERERKRNKVSGGEYLSFIDWIVSTPKVIEEKFWDIKILHDSDVATVHFKYSFHQNSKKTIGGMKLGT
jgi:hypothetical protein